MVDVDASDSRVLDQVIDHHERNLAVQGQVKQGSLTQNSAEYDVAAGLAMVHRIPDRLPRREASMEIGKDGAKTVSRGPIVDTRYDFREQRIEEV